MALTYGQGVALLRIAFGFYFLTQAVLKLTTGWMDSPKTMLDQYIVPLTQRGATDPFYRPFLEGVVQPNALLFSQLVTIGELLVAISLILGLFTRLGSLGVIFLCLNYWFMKGTLNNAGSSDRLCILAALVFILTAAGLVWGLDGVLRRRLGDTPVASWLVGAGRDRTTPLTAH